MSITDAVLNVLNSKILAHGNACTVVGRKAAALEKWASVVKEYGQSTTRDARDARDMMDLANKEFAQSEWARAAAWQEIAVVREVITEILER